MRGRSTIRLYLVRHATTDWNIERRWQGIRDVPLNEHGRRQVQTVARAFGSISIDTIVTSDLARARETAEAISGTTGAPVEVLRTFRERSFGRWEGRTNAELAMEYPDDVARYRADRDTFCPPGGQSWVDFSVDAVAAFESLLESRADERVAVVSHGGTTRAFINHVLGVERTRVSRFNLDNASISIVDRVTHELSGEEFWQLVAMNATNHLDGLDGS